MSTIVYWFRNDLRLADNVAFAKACQSATRLLPVYCHDPAQDVQQPWGFARTGAHRKRWLNAHLRDITNQLKALGSDLVELHGHPIEQLPMLAKVVGAGAIVCEEIAAPEEQAQVAALRGAAVQVDTVWQSSMLHPDDLPFSPTELPDVFSTFRNLVEHESILPRAPLAAPSKLPPLPDLTQVYRQLQGSETQDSQTITNITADARSSFPYYLPALAGGEGAANAHLANYLARKLPHSYKATRNGLTGVDYSSKFSPWLATGAISARQIYSELKRFETDEGANEGTYWLWFELLWRDYFRCLHLKYGRQLYRAGGLSVQAVPAHDADKFQRWCRGETGQPLVDAGMRELAATGYLSNRMRQIVASYLIHDLSGDWRAGAAWFESQLLDFDVYSNQGNWLYIAGRGTDPRGGRRFNPVKQAHDHDPDGEYQRLWGVV